MRREAQVCCALVSVQQHGKVPLQGRDVTGPSAGGPRPRLGLSTCIQAQLVVLLPEDTVVE